MHSMALPTPSSCDSARLDQLWHYAAPQAPERTLRICSPANFAFAICFSSETALMSASERFSTVMFLTADPIPSVATRSA